MVHEGQTPRPLTSSKSGGGYGKTLHYAGHAAYSRAVRSALRAAIKTPGLPGCLKLKMIREALRKKLEAGTPVLYGTRHSGGAKGVEADWDAALGGLF